MWKEATKIYSTCRSGEFRGYCDLHRRRGFDTCSIFSADGRCNDVVELAGDRLRTEGDGDSRGNPLALE